MIARFLRFNLVSLGGVLVQVAAFWILLHVTGVSYRAAGPLAVATAVTHNFVWHWAWTWADRRASVRSAGRAFWRFVGANGLVSLVANVLAMPLFVERLGLPPTPAMLVTIGGAGVVNFWLSDRVAFRRGPCAK